MRSLFRFGWSLRSHRSQRFFSSNWPPYNYNSVLGELVSAAFDGLPGVMYGQFMPDKGHIDCMVDYRFEQWVPSTYLGITINKTVVTDGGACFDGVLNPSHYDTSYVSQMNTWLTPLSFDNIVGVYMACYSNDDAIDVYCHWLKTPLLPRMMNGIKINAITVYEPAILCGGVLSMMQDEKQQVSVGTSEIGITLDDGDYWMLCGHSTVSFDETNMSTVSELRLVHDRFQIGDPLKAHAHFNVASSKQEIDECRILAHVQGSFVTWDTKEGRGLEGVDVALAPVIEDVSLPRPSCWIDSGYAKDNMIVKVDNTPARTHKKWFGTRLYCVVDGVRHYVRVMQVASFAYAISLASPKVCVRLTNALICVNDDRNKSPVETILHRGRSGTCFYDENGNPFGMFTAIFASNTASLYVLQSVGNLTAFLENETA